MKQKSLDRVWGRSTRSTEDVVDGKHFGVGNKMTVANWKQNFFFNYKAKSKIIGIKDSSTRRLGLRRGLKEFAVWWFAFELLMNWGGENFSRFWIRSRVKRIRKRRDEHGLNIVFDADDDLVVGQNEFAADVELFVHSLVTCQYGKIECVARAIRAFARLQYMN